MYNGFKPEKSHENDPEILAWAKEANIWATLYLIYDENERHMETAFYNNGLYRAPASMLHEANIGWIMEIGQKRSENF